MKRLAFCPYNIIRGEKMKEKPNRISELRKACRLSQERFSDEINVSQGMLSNYENKGDIPTDMLKKIAKYFDVSIDYLLKQSDDCRHHSEHLSNPEYNLVSLYRSLSLNLQRQVDKIVCLILSERFT